MPVLATMGIKSLHYAEVNKSDPTKMPASDFKAVDVYQDTCTFEDKEPTTTVHKSETSNKKITIYSSEGSVLKFAIMDPSLDEKVAFEGGEKSGVEKSGSCKYTKPNQVVTKELAFKIVPVSGLALEIPCASVVAKRKTTYSNKGITLLEITVEPTYGITDTEDLTIPGAK